MIYEAGDKVRISSWEQLANIYGINDSGDIANWPRLTFQMDHALTALDTDRVVTIKEIVYENNTYGGYYLMEETGKYNWFDNLIEEKVEGYIKKPKLPQKTSKPINNRFDILDIR